MGETGELMKPTLPLMRPQDCLQAPDWAWLLRSHAGEGAARDAGCCLDAFE
jgi:hypothetical protein